MPQKVLKTSILFTALSLGASALNFIYYPLIARLLSVTEFGEVQLGVAFIMQAATLFTALSILALYFSARTGEDSQLTSQLERLVITTSIGLAVVVALFAAPLSSALQLPDRNLLYILSFIFIINIPCATWLGALQGNGQFIASGAIAITSASTKIAAGWLLISFGWGVYGALGGILLGTIIILPLATFSQRGSLFTFRSTFKRIHVHDLAFFRSNPQVLVVFTALLALALANTVDVIVSKSSLPPAIAGAYAQVSTATKIPYFAAVPVALVLFERFIRRSAGVRRTVPAFICALIGATALVVLLQDLVMRFFFATTGHDRTTFTLLCIAFSIYALNTLLAYRLLAHQRIKLMLLLCLSSLVTTIGLTIVGADTGRSIAGNYLLSQVISAVVAIGLQYTITHER